MLGIIPYLMGINSITIKGIMITIIDPRKIPQSDLPMIVSVGGTDIVSRLIHWRTHFWCNHSMLCIDQGQFVWESLNSWYGKGKMEQYMTPGTTLKFYQLKNINSLAIEDLRNYVANRIASPWYKKMYDWIGIFGEAIGFPKIHTPGLEYCSVDTIHAMQAMVSLTDADKALIAKIPSEQCPGYLDLVMNSNPNVFNYYGQYKYIKP